MLLQSHAPEQKKKKKSANSSNISAKLAKISANFNRKRRKDTLLGQQEIQWSGLRMWINSHRRMIRWFETMLRWNELITRRLFTNARSWLCKQWRWVRRVFCVPRGRHFAIWQFELQAASDVMHQIWQNMQQCLYHYDLQCERYNNRIYAAGAEPQLHSYKRRKNSKSFTCGEVEHARRFTNEWSQTCFSTSIEFGQLIMQKNISSFKRSSLAIL